MSDQNATPDPAAAQESSGTEEIVQEPANPLAPEPNEDTVIEPLPSADDQTVCPTEALVADQEPTLENAAEPPPDSSLPLESQSTSHLPPPLPPPRRIEPQENDGWIESGFSAQGQLQTPKTESFVEPHVEAPAQESTSEDVSVVEETESQHECSASSRPISIVVETHDSTDSGPSIVIPPVPLRSPPPTPTRIANAYQNRPLPRIPHELEKELLIGLVDRIERLYDEEKKKREKSDSICQQLRLEVETIKKRESIYLTQLAEVDDANEDGDGNQNHLMSSKYQELLEFDADAIDSIKAIQKWYRKIRLLQKFREIISILIKDSHNRDVVRAALNDSVHTSKSEMIKDVIELERNYVKNLSMIFQFFLSPLKSSCQTSKQMLEENEIDIIFMHIDLFLKLHRRQLIEMENLVETDPNTSLSEIFLDFGRLIPEYFVYTENYPRAVQLIHSSRKRTAFAAFLKKTSENPYCGRFPLAILLYFPISYVAKKFELIKALYSITLSDMPEYSNLIEAQMVFTDYMSESHEDREAAENLQKIITIQQSLYGYQAEATFYDRIFIREGLLNKVSEKNEDVRSFRYFFLFSDSLIITSLMNHRKSPFKVAQELRLSEILIQTQPDTPKLKNIFAIVTNGNGPPERFLATTLHERDEWIKEIKNAIAKHMKKTSSSGSDRSEPGRDQSKIMSNIRKFKSNAFMSRKTIQESKVDEMDIFKACAQGNVPALIYLIQQGHGLDKTNVAGDSPLHIAAAANDDRIITILLEHKLNLNSRNQKGETPLHMAAMGNHMKAACLLLEKGADPKISDTSGRHPANATNLVTLKRLIEDSLVSTLGANSIPELSEKTSKFGSIGREKNRQTTATMPIIDLFSEETTVDLLYGESIAIKIDEVVDFISGNVNRPVRLFITNYRLVLYSSSKGETPLGFQYDIPLNTIEAVDKISLVGTRSAGLELRCKDFRIVRVGFSQASDNRKRVQKTLCDNCSPFAFFHSIPNAAEDGWSVYSVESDFSRMNVPDPEWKITDINSEFRLCPTYNKRFAVPTIMLDSELKSVAQFRSRARIPALCWRKPSTGATICRSSQPRAGITGYRCPEDEKLLKAVSALNKRSDHLYIIDCRPRVNAVANQAKGAGFENTTNYTNCEVIFMDIENIHVVRDSWRKVQDLVYGIGQGDDSRWYSMLEGTHWLVHIQSIIRAAKFIVDQMNQKECSFLVHCSDGWDRTSQVVALSELLLDPHYRTVCGFEALIEKEWLSFGHKFATRCGHGPANRDSDQRSPIFLQFLDCVWQITRQFPSAFEFNERFLITIMDHVYNCRFGTFLCDSVGERHQVFIYNKPSLWTWMNQQMTVYKNENYSPIDAPLNPSDGMWNLRLWTNMYLRWTGIQPLIH